MYYQTVPSPLLAFQNVGETATVTVSESGYAGPFSASIGNVATGAGCVTPQITVSGGGGSFTVNSGPNPGTYCGTATLTVTDPRPGGKSATLPVQLTSTAVDIHSRRRKQ